PEPPRNVEAKEISRATISGGETVRFEFKNNATCVVYVAFHAVENAGRTTTIVEQLKEKSVLVSELPDDEVYKSFNVWVGNAGYSTSNKIDNRALGFRVNKEWVREMDIVPASITLNRYEKKVWVPLSTELTGESDEYLYFTSEVPGYASFVITGNTTQEVLEEESDQVPSESRSTDGFQLGDFAKKAGSDKNRNTILSIVIVVVALSVVVVLLKGMKE
ncbi:MAG: PGF-pre-PGF domain-containing protein, partial [Methanosarcina sp.]